MIPCEFEMICEEFVAYRQAFVALLMGLFLVCEFLLFASHLI